MTEEQRNELAQIIIDLESYIEYCQDKANKIDPQDSEFQWYHGKICGLDYARRKLIAYYNKTN